MPRTAAACRTTFSRSRLNRRSQSGCRARRVCQRSRRWRRISRRGPPLAVGLPSVPSPPSGSRSRSKPPSSSSRATSQSGCKKRRSLRSQSSQSINRPSSRPRRRIGAKLSARSPVLTISTTRWATMAARTRACTARSSRRRRRTQKSRMSLRNRISAGTPTRSPATSRAPWQRTPSRPSLDLARRPTERSHRLKCRIRTGSSLQ